MSHICCNYKTGPTNDSSMDLLLSVVSSKTKPLKVRRLAKKKSICCKRNEYCGCNGSASPLHKANIYRNNQIHQILKICNCFRPKTQDEIAGELFNLMVRAIAKLTTEDIGNNHIDNIKYLGIALLVLFTTPHNSKINYNNLSEITNYVNNIIINANIQNKTQKIQNITYDLFLLTTIWAGASTAKLNSIKELQIKVKQIEDIFDGNEELNSDINNMRTSLDNVQPLISNIKNNTKSFSKILRKYVSNTNLKFEMKEETQVDNIINVINKFTPNNIPNDINKLTTDIKTLKNKLINIYMFVKK